MAIKKKNEYESMKRKGYILILEMNGKEKEMGGKRVAIDTRFILSKSMFMHKHHPDP